MKKALLLGYCFSLINFSCNKPKDNPVAALGTASGCIARIVIPLDSVGISVSNKLLVDNLFKINGLTNKNYRFYRFSEDSVQTYFAPYAKFDDKNVRADHYANGLRIFSGDVIFNFKNDVLNFVGGDTTNGITLDTKAQLTLPQLRKLFIDNVEQFEFKGNQYKDSCLRAEFGYIDLNNGTGISQKNIVKAWWVKPNKNDYPCALYQDSNGKLIGYDNGIRTFR